MYRAMKIATWNVNSVRSRMDRLLVWLNKHRPDILCLQELKVTDDAFPYDPIREAGYHVAVHGQKTYNGVAILSREEPQSIAVGMGDDVADDQARLLEATFGDLTLLSAYIPNGSEVGSDKYIYKLRWLSRLRAKLERDYDPAQQLVLCGDFNVAWDDLDVANPEQWAGSVLSASVIPKVVCTPGGTIASSLSLKTMVSALITSSPRNRRLIGALMRRSTVMNVKAKNPRTMPR
jgi:exodeoxyribonuclease-3